MSMPQQVRLVEVGPRDGLQNEKQPISVADKVRLVDDLSAAGLSYIEVGSFVSPKWVPQMADAAEVLSGIARRPGVTYAALVPNMKGYEGARAGAVPEIEVFAAASEAFSQKNINCTIAESLERFRPVVEAAKSDGVRVRAAVSVVTDCPYSGPVEPAAVARVTEDLLNMGCYQVGLGDTIGRGTPDTIGGMLDEVLKVADADKLAGHYHDTGGMAIANIDVSLERGLRTFDAAVSGLGGCPFAPGAKGNVATGRVIDHLACVGYVTGIDRAALSAAEDFVGTLGAKRS